MKLAGYVSPGMTQVVLIVASMLVLILAAQNLREALKTGIAQRLPDTPRYSRKDDPGMYWILVIFDAVTIGMFVGLIIACLLGWLPIAKRSA